MQAAQANTSTRNHILYMLKTQGPLSVAELTRQTDITNMAVRRHLNTLEKDGLIESETVRQSMGRPTAVYRLSEAAEDLFPKKYHVLMSDLLNELVEEAGEEMVDLLFSRRKQTLQLKYEANIQGRSLEEKVAVLAGIQNDNGYMAKWRKNESTSAQTEEYELIEHNCPIAHVANQYQQACQCELELFRSLLDADVARTTCIAKGDQMCTYLIRALNDRSEPATDQDSES